MAKPAIRQGAETPYVWAHSRRPAFGTATHLPAPPYPWPAPTTPRHPARPARLGRTAVRDFGNIQFLGINVGFES